MTFWSEKSNIIEPVRPYRFRIQNASANGSSYWFWAKSISKPSFEINKEEYQLINHKIKFPGVLTWKDISIKMIDYKEGEKSSKSHELYNFIKDSRYSFDQSKDGIAKSNIIMNIIIEQLDADGNQLEKWTLKNAFITSIDNTELNYETETLSEITINVAYDEAELT